MRHTLMIAAAFLLAACATSPYVRYYRDKTGGVGVTKMPNLVASKGKPRLINSKGIKEDVVILTMEEEGYVLIGYSAFNAGSASGTGAIAQAKKVHASVVYLISQHSNTESGSVPVTLPGTQTPTTSFNGGVIGGGDAYASYYGDAYTTTYGTTTYLPYSVRRYDYLATYWVKLKRPVLGLFLRHLTPEDEQEINSNKGMEIVAVRWHSPAYQADILAGDILRKIGDVEINTSADYHEALIRYQGGPADVVIDRKGKKITKDIALNMAPR